MIARWCGNSVRVIEERYSHIASGHLQEVADLAGRGPSGGKAPEPEEPGWQPPASQLHLAKGKDSSEGA